MVKKTIKDFIKKNRAYIKDLRRETYSVMMTVVLAMDGSTKDKISGGGRSGRIYTRRTVKHQASAPGEFPKSDTGDLVSSLYIKGNKLRLEVEYGAKALHGKYLEFKPPELGGRPWLKVQSDIFYPMLTKELRKMNRNLLLKHFR